MKAYQLYNEINLALRYFKHRYDDISDVSITIQDGSMYLTKETHTVFVTHVKGTIVKNAEDRK